MKAPALVLALALALAACGNKPRVPDWLVNATSAQARYERAYLAGDDRVAQVEFDLLRKALASTGEPAWVARAELTRCALRVASLDIGACSGFEALRSDAPAAERAYGDFLAGQLPPQDAPLLPEPYRAITNGSMAGGSALQAIKDPLSRLVAAGVLLRTARADPATLQLAAETASQQGWRRPLIAWLGAQALRAEKAGQMEEAQRLRRRMALAAGAP